MTRPAPNRTFARALTCVLLALALVAGGCGGGSNFKSDYKNKDAELNKLGVDLGQTVNNLKKYKDIELASRFDGYASRARKLVSDFGKLKPPSKDKADVASLRSALSVIATDMTACASAARAHNAKTFRTALRKLFTDASAVRSPSTAIRQREGIKRSTK